MSMKIAVVIPCYKVRDHVLGVIAAVPANVEKIYCVDDACPDSSGVFITENNKDLRVSVIRHEVNKGVGGAVMTGYQQAVNDRMDIIVKIDGDGQMDPTLLPLFTGPIEKGQCDYTKGNRFFYIEDVRAMPKIRLFGNAGLSFLTKISSGYWRIFDPTNGYTALHCAVIPYLPLQKISNHYFFESDILFRLNTLRCKVEDIPMRSVYNDEVSNLHVGKVILPFLRGHLKNFSKRIFYNYYLRDFSVASLELVIGLILCLFGMFWGLGSWSAAARAGEYTSAGNVMLAVLPILIGFQLLLAFLTFDQTNDPKTPIHPRIRKD